MSEYTMISTITLSNYGKNTLYLYTRDITKEDQEQSKSFFTTGSYLSYIRGADYKGLNRSVTSVIYHMVWQYRVHSQVNNV
jgi:hypothetical protein